MGTLDQGGGIVTTYPDPSPHFCAWCGPLDAAALAAHQGGCPLVRPKPAKRSKRTVKPKRRKR